MHRVITLLIAFIVCCSSAPVHAEIVKRHLLALVDGSEGRIPTAILGDTVPGTEESVEKEYRLSGQKVYDLAKLAEMPLNHIGYIVDFVDITTRLPDDREMQSYDGIVTWFQDNKLKGAAAYGSWITRQLQQGKRLLCLGEFGFDYDDNMVKTPQEILESFFKAFGIEYQPADATQSPLLIEVIAHDPRMTEFERTLKGGLTNFRRLAVIDKGAKVFLKLRRKDTGTTSDAIFINSKGGYVLSDYVSYVNPGDEQTRWRIHPFAFFAEALQQRSPVPDVTTQNGMRLFYSHIDGDGITSMSHIDREKSCGEITFEKILTQYRIPISASVIIGDILQAHGDERTALIATLRKIFALPNVEAASHGWAHPLIWTEGNRKLAFKLSGYTYSPQQEIGESIAYINEHLLPPGKQSRLFFWTGNCRPDAEALAFVADHQILALNGGDTRFDNAYPSYSYVAPLFHHVERDLQNFSSNANEIVYTNIWSGPFYGYRYAINTFQRTESPLRIRPINVYYHYFSLEREASALALTQVYDWVLQQEVAPLFTSEYLQILQGFLTTTLDRVSNDHWIVTNQGDLRTIRFDHTTQHVDLARSSGVLGFFEYQGSLYVHLANGERAEIWLTAARQTRPYLMKANGRVQHLVNNGGNIHFEQRVMGNIQFRIGGLTPQKAYSITLPQGKTSIVANDSGEVTLTRQLESNQFAWIPVEIAAN